jgi:hypothetical protein
MLQVKVTLWTKEEDVEEEEEEEKEETKRKLGVCTSTQVPLTHPV